MTDTPAPSAHSAIRVLAALAELGEATAADVAEQAGLGYSTTTPKLRAWEDTGQAQRRHTDDGRILWRLTPAGRAATAAPADRHPTGADPTIAAPPVDTGAAEPLAAPAVPAEPIPSGPGEPEPPAGSDRTDRDDPDDDRSPSDPDGADGTAAAEDTDAVPPVGAGRHDAPDTETRTGTEDDLPPDEGADAAPTVDDTDQRNEPPTEPAPPSDPAASTGEREEARPVRRTAGSMRAAILDVCQAHPDRPFKVGELCRLIDAANTGTGASKASQGAVYNAATKLAAAGILTQTVEKPATFQLTAGSD